MVDLTSAYDLLAPNQRLFVDEWLKDRNGTRAAIAAGYKEQAAHAQASRMLKNVKVKAAIDERLKALQKRAETTLDDILNELDESRAVALNAPIPQTSAAVSATVAKAKLLGLMVEKSEVDHKGKIDQKHFIDTSNLTEDQLRAISAIRINGR